MTASTNTACSVMTNNGVIPVEVQCGPHIIYSNVTGYRLTDKKKEFLESLSKRFLAPQGEQLLMLLQKTISGAQSIKSDLVSKLIFRIKAEAEKRFVGRKEADLNASASSDNTVLKAVIQSEYTFAKEFLEAINDSWKKEQQIQTQVTQVRLSQLRAMGNEASPATTSEQQNKALDSDIKEAEELLAAQESLASFRCPGTRLVELDISIAAAIHEVRQKIISL